VDKLKGGDSGNKLGGGGEEEHIRGIKGEFGAREEIALENCRRVAWGCVVIPFVV